ncbi:hypothetical protein [Mesorhizobium sp. 1B3]|uniref:hypothetical protein n=1 Tax=Mesorhizobium sp. 1B3 TaxID=3243599 RepID=UPI003D98D144
MTLVNRFRGGDIARLFCGDEEDIDDELEDDEPLRLFEPERFSRREVNAALKLEFSEFTRG